MADQPFTKLPQLPWPALVGTSLVLHAGALFASMPIVLQIDASSSNSSANIPVTLVDGDDTPVTAPTSPSAANAPVEESLATVIGGQSPAISPQQNTPTGQQPIAQPADFLEESSDTTPPVENRQVSATPSPADQSLAEPGDRSELTATPEATEETQPPVETTEQPTDVEPGVGAIAISIVGISTVPRGTPGDWPDLLPTLQSTADLRIANHSCGSALPTGEVTVGLIIAADGSVIQTFAPAENITAATQIASCLLTEALDIDASAIRFTPAYTGQEAIITDRMQLTLRFTSG